MATVRYFAAAAEAAGTEQEQVGAGTLGLLIDELRSRHGARFTRVLEVSSVLHDGRYVEDTSTPLTDDAVLDILPPFAGG